MTKKEKKPIAGMYATAIKETAHEEERMNPRVLKVLSATLITVFLITSCGPLPPPGTALTAEERESARKTCIAKYTGLGAIGGGLVGALVGGKKAAAGALIGAAAGGALAFAIAWGHCLNVYSDLKSYPTADARATAQKIGYEPSKGNVTKINTFSLNPKSVAPGGRVKINGSYYVMAPEGAKEVKVTETRTVSYYDPAEKKWTELGSVDQDVTAALGTRKAEGNFDVPSDVPEGRYRITFKVAALDRTDESTKELDIKKGHAKGPTDSEDVAVSSHKKDAEDEADQVAAAYQKKAGEREGGKSLRTAGPSAGASVSKTTAEVTSKTLNVRKEPSNKGDLLAVIKKGEVYEVLGNETVEKDKWFRLRLEDGSEGWAMGRYLKVKE